MEKNIKIKKIKKKILKYFELNKNATYQNFFHSVEETLEKC